MVALTFGYTFSASTAALVMNGRYDRLAPSRALKSSLALARIREMSVRSTSTVAVSWAETCSDSTIRLAMVLRSRDIFSVVPRSVARARPPAASPRRPEPSAARGGSGSGRPAASAAFLASSAAASTSCLRTRPPTPVPVTEDRSTLCSAASLRTSGVT